MKPTKVFPAWRCLQCQRGNCRLPNYDQPSGAAPTSPPKGVFRTIRSKEHRQAVRTHYGPTWIRQMGYSPRHRRNSVAGPTILQLVSASYEQTKALISAVLTSSQKCSSSPGLPIVTDQYLGPVVGRRDSLEYSSASSGIKKHHELVLGSNLR